tara:strand:+ start:961 stop:2049 length:1089 start_codon:yes stop_codon:yes gene_type:complete
MAEETLSEALSNLNDEQIDKAALPENKRVEEDVSEESTYVELTEEEAESLAPVTDDSIQEDFEASQESQEEGDLSEVEKRAKTARSRINQAVKQAKDFQRRELQALQYAKQLLEQNQQLSNQLSYSQNSAVEDQLKVQENYTDEFENRVDAQADAAKSIMQKAYDSGDQEALVDAQQLLARAEADRSSLNQYKQQLDDYKKNLETYNTQQQELAQQAQQMPQQAPQQAQEPVYTEPSDRAKKWATDNEWFGTNKGLTNVAFEVHQELAQSGIDTESDQYYSQLDNGIKKKVSDLTNSFNPNTNAGNGRQPVQTVVSTTRTTGNGRSQNDRRIELTPSEQQLAQRLGVPFKEYAKQKMRLQQS